MRVFFSFKFFSPFFFVFFETVFNCGSNWSFQSGKKRGEKKRKKNSHSQERVGFPVWEGEGGLGGGREGCEGIAGSKRGGKRGVWTAGEEERLSELREEGVAPLINFYWQ